MKKKKIKCIFSALFLLFAVLAGVAAMQPDSYRVEESVVVSAAPEQVFPHLNALSSWNAWSPWVKFDPQAKMTFSGPESGVGATMGWNGNSKIGEGSVTVLESRMDQMVKYRLDFVRPMADTATAEFTLVPDGNHGTQVTWSMYGKHKNFLSKAMHFLFCKRMLAGQFQEGLSNLKTVVEGTRA